MQVLTPSGTPRTNGEVYSIIRRRRDERTANALPSFALQMSLAPSYPLLSYAQTQQVGGGPSSALARKSEKSSVPSISSASPLVTASPPLVVMLTEVQVLRYLVHSASLSSNKAAHEEGKALSKEEALKRDGLEALYGPSSVYDQEMYHHHRRLSANEEGAASTLFDQYRAEVHRWYTIMQRSPCPTQRQFGDQTGRGAVVKEDGTYSTAVNALLCLYENHGRTQELQWSQRIRQLVHAAARAQAKSARDSIKGSSSSPASSSAAVPAGRPGLYLLSPPTPLYKALRSGDTETSSTDACEASADDRYASQLLTELDVLQLVNTRPERVLDVYRVLNDWNDKWARWTMVIQNFVAASNGTYTGPPLAKENWSGEPPHDADSFAEAVVSIFQ